MAVAPSSRPRVSVDGKFFRLGEKKFYVKGLTYGPFAPASNPEQSTFAGLDQTTRDLLQIRELGANLVRVYHVPPKWFLDLASEHGLKVLVDIPWNQHVCFLDIPRGRAEARAAVRRAVFGCAGHPAVFAFSVANEIPSDIVRWSGAKAVADFIDDLIAEAKDSDPDCLCTFTSYPPTEFLRSQSADFISFNVYLHQLPAFSNYLARLQMQAESKPLLLTEFGLDSGREGQDRQADLVPAQIEEGFRAGLAGAVVFSFTDDWWRGGQQIEDWTMGLTTRAREPKPAFAAVQKCFEAAPYFPLARFPKVSVVVASFNGERTLRACLESLRRLRYPDYEVILVDDGSADGTRQAAQLCPNIRYFRHEQNLGLSTARNTGIAAAAGEIVAFTDADCRPDEDWLYYLVAELLRGDFVGVGGPNLLPPDDSLVAATVMVSPGGPAHVMLTDRQAEHLPGCNMAFFKSALAQVGGFDPIFHKAGDDVDLCWRLQEAGYKLGFSPSGMVWHYRRSRLRDYLKQQRGYGEAEALLVRKHPEYFNSFGGSLWRGRIYSAARFGLSFRPAIIYRGLFGSAGFQSLYTANAAFSLMLCTSLEYHVLVTLPLCVLSAVFHRLLPLALTSLSVSLAVCIAAGLQAPLPRNKTRLWSRPLVMLLYFLQPIARGWARYQGRLVVPRRPSQRAVQENLDSVALRTGGHGLREVHYWAQQRLDRLALMTELLRRLDGRGWPHRADMAWSEYDVEVYDGRWTKVQLGTVAEEHPQGKQLIRCRLRSRWSLRAKVVFWGLAGLELAALGLAARHHGWPWLVLLSLPLLAGFLRGQERALRSLLIVVLDELAKDWRLLKVWPRPAGIESSEASAAPATDGEQRQPSPGNASQPQGSPSAVP